jgi:hypothetical protein
MTSVVVVIGAGQIARTNLRGHAAAHWCGELAPQ